MCTGTNWTAWTDLAMTNELDESDGNEGLNVIDDGSGRDIHPSVW